MISKPGHTLNIQMYGKEKISLVLENKFPSAYVSTSEQGKEKISLVLDVPMLSLNLWYTSPDALYEENLVVMRCSYWRMY